MEIKIGKDDARGVYFDREGEKRFSFSRPISARHDTQIWLNHDIFGDENAVTYLAKSFENAILNECNADLLNNYRNSRLSLVVCFFTLDENADPTMTKKKVGRYEVNVFKNANTTTMSKIVEGEIKVDCLVPDETVVAEAERLALEPIPENETVLDRHTYRNMTKSLEKTPVRKRSNWSFPLKDPKYGDSVIKFENGKFIDYTSTGPQKVHLHSSEEIINNSHSDIDVLSANAAMFIDP